MALNSLNYMLTLLVLAWLHLITQQLSFGVNNRTCFGLPFKPSNNYHVEYELTPHSDDSFRIDLITKDQNLIRSYHTTKQSFDFNAEAEISLCFTSLRGQYKTVELDVWLDTEMKIRNVAVKSGIYELHRQLGASSQKLNKVIRHEMIQEDKQNYHSNIIYTNENTIKLWTVVKIIVVSLLVVVQILILNQLTKQNKFVI